MCSPLGATQATDNGDKGLPVQFNSQHLVLHAGLFFASALYTQIFKLTSSEYAENASSSLGMSYSSHKQLQEFLRLGNSSNSS